MKQAQFTIFLGIFIILVTISGIPIHIKKIIYLFPALFIIAIGITHMRKSRKSQAPQVSEFYSYSETTKISSSHTSEIF